jgi:7-cyano-7-deazaguanine synthase
MNIAGFGDTIKSGLTSKKLDVVADAFLPMRNLLFLICGAAHAYKKGAAAVLIGLLNEGTHLFPDQTERFVSSASKAITIALGRPIEVRAPLRQFLKQDVVEIAKSLGIRDTYSCHRGGARPCGTCIACREFATKPT